MNSARYENPRLSQIEKLKLLAEEMVKRKIQSLNMGDEFKEEHVFHKIVFAQSVKHRSQIFTNRNKKKMLNYFSLNKGSNDELDKFKKNLDKIAKDAKRRQSTMQIKEKNNNKKINKKYKNFAHHFSLKSQKNKNNNEVKEIDEQFFNDKYSDSNYDSDNYDDNNDDEEDDEDEENEDDNDKEDNKNNSKDNNDEDDSEKRKIDKEKYEVRYANPKEIKIIYDKENSPIYNVINNTVLIKKNHKDKARYFFDKQMKLLEIKKKKIEKKRKIIEDKNKEFFQISNYLDKNSMKLVENNPNYRPIQYKSVEEYKFHLAKIEINQNNIKLKKKLEEKKEIDETINYKKLNRKNFSQLSWEKFVEQEYYWQEEKRKANELLKYKIKNQINNKPKINKKSIIIFEKMNKNNNNHNKYENHKDNIFTRLYNEQEKYDNKLKIKRQESMPTFKPYINKSKNKKKKLFKGLNNIDFNYKDNGPSIKTVKNNQIKKENSFILDYKDKNKNPIRTPNNYNNSKNLSKKLLSENSFYNNSKKNLQKKLSSENSFYIKNKNSPLTTKNTNILNKNKKMKKNISMEYNIDMTDYKKIISNKNSSTIKNNNINSKNNNNISFPLNGNKIEKNLNKKKEIKSEKNLKDYINNIEVDVNINKGNIRNIKDEEESIDEELNKAIKKASYLDFNFNNNDENKLLYHLNIRDNTSNSKRANVVLTSYKYLDFFKLKK